MSGDGQPRGRAVPDRARKRAIRAQAAKAGVAYSVAARQLGAGTAPNLPGAGEMLASQGRTVYPPGADSHRQRLVESRERRSAEQRRQDSRLAAELPFGRARHLAERFPPTRSMPGTGVGPLYSGEGRHECLALLYRAVAAESPELVPAVGDLAWIAELGEETAVDIACAELDRAVRLMLDDPDLLTRVEATLGRGLTDGRWEVRADSVRLSAVFQAAHAAVDWHEGEPLATGLPLAGMRQILDAVLIVGEDGHAAGTRVRTSTGRTGTIVEARWGSHGPPTGYRVHVDATPPAILAAPADLVVLAGQAPF